MKNWTMYGSVLFEKVTTGRVLETKTSLKCSKKKKIHFTWLLLVGGMKKKERKLNSLMAGGDLATK